MLNPRNPDLLMKAKLMLGVLLLTQGVTKAVDNLDVPKPIGLELGTRLREVPIHTSPTVREFMDEFSVRTRDRMTFRLYDKLSPVRMQLNILHNPNQNAVGQSQVLSAMNNSFRRMAGEALLETPYVQKQLEMIEDKLDKVGKIFRVLVKSFLTTSIDEKEMTVMNDPALQYLQDEWRSSMGKMDPYGIQLHFPNPYIYVATRVGHYEGDVLFYVHARLYALKMESHKVEMYITKPLPENFNLSVGMAYSPNNDYRRLGKMAVGKIQLEKFLGADPSWGAFAVGCEIHQKLDLLVSYSKPF
jgi:hypothetical protein